MSYADIKQKRVEGAALVENKPKDNAKHKTKAPKCPSFAMLLEGEKILAVKRPALRAFLPMFMILTVFIFLGTPNLGESGIRLFQSLFVSAILTMPVYQIRHWSSCYVFTNKRIISQNGLFSESVTEVRIKDVRAINMRSSLSQLYLGLGTISIGSAATGSIEIKCKNISSPREVVAMINAMRPQ